MHVLLWKKSNEINDLSQAVGIVKHEDPAGGRRGIRAMVYAALHERELAPPVGHGDEVGGAVRVRQHRMQRSPAGVLGGIGVEVEGHRADGATPRMIVQGLPATGLVGDSPAAVEISQHSVASKLVEGPLCP